MTCAILVNNLRQQKVEWATLGNNDDREWNIEMIIRQRPKLKQHKVEDRHDQKGVVEDGDVEVERVLDSILNTDEEMPRQSSPVVVPGSSYIIKPNLVVASSKRNCPVYKS